MISLRSSAVSPDWLHHSASLVEVQGGRGDAGMSYHAGLHGSRWRGTSLMRRGPWQPKPRSLSLCLTGIMESTDHRTRMVGVGLVVVGGQNHGPLIPLHNNNGQGCQGTCGYLPLVELRGWKSSGIGPIRSEAEKRWEYRGEWLDSGVLIKPRKKVYILLTRYEWHCIIFSKNIWR